MLCVYSSLALLEMVVWGSVNIIVIQNKETFFNEYSSCRYPVASLRRRAFSDLLETKPDFWESQSEGLNTFWLCVVWE